MAFSRHFYDAGVWLLVASAGLVHAADAPAETARGRAMLDAYFARETTRIADACLADIKTKADWEAKRPELRQQFLE